jgi:hypothetical protein
MIIQCCKSNSYDTYIQQCTKKDDDAWKTGKHIDCCSGLSENNENGKLKCRTDPNKQCTKKDDDAWKTGKHIDCCSGLSENNENGKLMCRNNVSTGIYKNLPDIKKTSVLNHSNFYFNNSAIDASCSSYIESNTVSDGNNGIIINYGNKKSGRVETRQLFKDGIYIIESNIADSGSCFPAIWLYGSSDNQKCEIDLMETMKGQTFATCSLVNNNTGNSTQVMIGDNLQGKYELSGKNSDDFYKFILLRLNNHVVFYLYDINDTLDLKNLSPKGKYVEYDLNYVNINRNNNPTDFKVINGLAMQIVLNVSIQAQDNCSLGNCSQCNYDSGSMHIKSIIVHEF